MPFDIEMVKNIRNLRHGCPPGNPQNVMTISNISLAG